MTVSLKKSKRDTISAQTYTSTVHHVHVDLAELLGAFDVTDEVVLIIATPSGRPKRVALQGGFLVEPIDTDADSPVWR